MRGPRQGLWGELWPLSHPLALELDLEGQIAKASEELRQKRKSRRRARLWRQMRKTLWMKRRRRSW